MSLPFDSDAALSSGSSILIDAAVDVNKFIARHPNRYATNTFYEFSKGIKRDVPVDDEFLEAPKPTPGPVIKLTRVWSNEYKRLWKAFYNAPGAEKKLACKIDIGKKYQEFNEAALESAKIILSEIGESDEKKKVPPLKPDGEEYLHNDIYFRLVRGTLGISMENVMKIAGHEIKGITEYIYLSLNEKIKDLYFPLIAIIDFHGYRIVALSPLPIEHSTLQYGSSNGGFKLHMDTRISTIMENAAKQLNLKPHFVCSNEHTQKYQFHTCGDVELHRSKDNAIYLTGTHRVMPPAFTEGKPTNAHLYRLLRPEFVRNFKNPLSPDAFCRWGRCDDESHFDKSTEEDLFEATKFLEETIIPGLGRHLDDKYSQKEISIEELLLVTHRHGVNHRYLGLLRSHVTKPNMSQLLLRECISRTVKNIIRNELRDKIMDQEDELAGIAFIVVQVYSSIFKNEEFWKSTLKESIVERFMKPLRNEFETVDFLALVPIDSIFRRVQDLTGIRWSSKAIDKLKSQQPLTEKDIESIDPILKAPPLAYLADGLEQRQVNHAILSLKLPCLEAGIVSFTKALQRQTRDVFTLNQLVATLQEVAIMRFHSPEENAPRFPEQFGKAVSLLEDAAKLDPKDSNILRNYANTLLTVAQYRDSGQERTQLLDKAIQAFETLDDRNRKEEAKVLKKNLSRKNLKKFQVCLVGPGSVGKTSIFRRIIGEPFLDNTDQTQNPENKNLLIMVDNEVVRITLVDTGGQEIFREITSSFYRNAHGVFGVYDVTKPMTLEDLQATIVHAKDFTKANQAQFLIVGNKIDLAAQRKVTPEDARSVTDSLKISNYFETSAKEGDNVMEAFLSLVDSIYKKSLLVDAPAASSPPEKTPKEVSNQPARGGKKGPCTVI